MIMCLKQEKTKVELIDTEDKTKANNKSNYQQKNR